VAEPNISGYTIVQLLGAGGFASVYLATEDTSGGRAAIKVLHAHASKPDDVRRFERERMSMRALSGHPNIVGVYDSGETDDGQHYTVLEYVDGGSARDKMNEGGALHWATVVEIGVQICAALDVAHRSGVLHRDVKPANILLDHNLAKLSDFGIARLIGQSQVTAAQSIIGTLAYTPPEVFHNKPFDGRGDIYQLGISLYEMLLGRAPFTSAAADNKATVIRRILDNPAPPLAQFDIPAPLSDLLDEVLAKDPADRPQSADSFGRRLNDIEIQMGRTPTDVGADTQTMIQPVTPASTDETMTSKAMSSEETQAIVPASIWPAAQESRPLLEPPPVVSVAPEPPDTGPPLDANITMAEPRPTSQTSLIEQPPSATSAETVAVPLGGDPPRSEEPAPNPEDGSKKRRRWPWVAAILVLAGAVVGSVAVWQYADDQTDDQDDEAPGEVIDPTDERTPEFVVLDDPAFAAPGGSDGVVFASVANSFGLTMVGGAGSGEAVGQQRSVVWTLGPVDGERTIKLQSEFAMADGLSASTQRLWDIAVIDGEQFLAVGEKQGGGGTNGIAWIGDQARFLRPTNDASFQTAARESLHGAVGEASKDEFIVVGSRGEGSNLAMGLWILAKGDGWTTPTWSTIDVGTGADGVLNDVTVDEDLAVAVGAEESDGAKGAVMLIRRGESWANLITSIPDAELHSVTIAGERIVAVGQKNGSGGPVPFAVVTNDKGEGFVHNLPVRDSNTTGIARSIGVLADGRVVAVGDVDGESDRDGAIWELLPSADLSEDKWTTRATPDLRQDGFVELWAIDEFDDEVYVFGRTEADAARPAGAWTLNLADVDAG